MMISVGYAADFAIPQRKPGEARPSECRNLGHRHCCTPLGLEIVGAVFPPVDTGVLSK